MQHILTSYFCHGLNLNKNLIRYPPQNYGGIYSFKISSRNRIKEFSLKSKETNHGPLNSLYQISNFMRTRKIDALRPAFF